MHRINEGSPESHTDKETIFQRPTS